MKKIKYALLLFGLFSVFTASSQYWEPIATMPGRVQATCVDGNFFYVAYHTDTNIAEVARWDGISWTKFPKVELYGNDSISKLIVYHNELYLAGAFDSATTMMDINGSTRYIIKFDGTKWDSVGYKRDIHNDPFYWYRKITDMEVFKDTLYICGSNLISFDGNKWKLCEKKINNNIRDIEINKDTLFVCGHAVGGRNVGFLKEDTVIEHSYYKKSGGKAEKIFFHNNELFIVFSNSDNNIVGLYKLLNSQTTLYVGVISNLCKSTCLYNNEIFVGLNQIQNDTLFPLNSIPIYNTLVNIDTFKGILIATGGDFTYNNQVPNVISVDPFRSFGNIEGMVFLDEDNDCQKDSNENVFDKGLIEVKPGPYYLKINSNGTFKYSFPDTTYMVKYFKPDGIYKYYQLNTCNNYTRELRMKNGIADSTLLFAVKQMEGAEDIEIDLISNLGWRARSGFTEYYKIRCRNIGSLPMTNISTHFTYDPKLVLKGYITPDSFNANNLIYNISKLDPGETKTFGFTFQVPTSIAMGDSIHFFAQILTSQNDTDLTNNYDTLIQTIVGAVDPNDKTCFPAITTNKNIKKIEYLIRFQNVGTDTAYKVVVVDTIDIDFLPLTKVVIDEVSHPYILNITGNTLIWTFNNILLVDSLTDEPNSHGYIKYTASVKPGLKVGDTIINRAYIYFDYQKVLPTNIAMSVIIKPDVSIKELENTEDGITIYPNPAKDELLIKTKEKINLVSVQVYDMMGNRVMDTQTKENQRIRLPDLESGHYILILNSDQRSFVKKFIVLTK